MIDALISGRLAAAPKAGTSRNSNRFATARVMVPVNAEERISVSVIAFDPTAVEGLLALGSGDAVALAGELTPKVWTDQQGESRPSLDMKAHALVTPYHVTRTRRAVQGERP
jgi:single-stranded DNA-binding protein